MHNYEARKLNSRIVCTVPRTVANQIEEREPMAGRPNNCPTRSALFHNFFQLPEALCTLAIIHLRHREGTT